MKLKNVLNMDIDVKVTDEELILGMEVNTRNDLIELMTDEEVERLEELVTEISGIYNKAITRDLQNDMGIEFFGYKREINSDRKKDLKEDEKLQELYDKLSDEHKARADKMMEDIEKLKTPEEKAKRVLEEILNDIFRR